MNILSPAFLRTPFAVLAAIGLGGWIASYRVPPSELSEQAIEQIRDEAMVKAEIVMADHAGTSLTDSELQRCAEYAVDRKRWENRRHARWVFREVAVGAGLAFVVCLWASAYLAKRDRLSNATRVQNRIEEKVRECIRALFIWRN